MTFNMLKLWSQTFPKYLTTLILLLLGAVCTLGFAPFGFWPISIVAIAVFAFLIKEQSLPHIMLRSFIFGLGLYGAGVHWIYVSIHNFGGASPVFAGFLVLLFCMFLALVFCLPFYIWGKWFSRHSLSLLLAFPACWVLGEWVRTWLLTGFPWLFAGYSMSSTWLAGWAPITGVIGLSLMAVLNACVIAELPNFRQLPKAFPIALLCCLGCWLMGPALTKVKWTVARQDTVNVGLVQPNISQHIKLNWTNEQVEESLEQLRIMSGKLRQNNWIVWPEAAIPTALNSLSARPFIDEMANRAALSESTVFTGVISYDEERNEFYNSIMVLDQNRNTYHKRRLVPFGEYVPMENYLRGFIQLFDLPTSYIQAGSSSQDKLNIGGLFVAPAVCYELVYPDLIAQSARQSQVLLSVSNLGWFLDSIQSEQFLQMAKMRALETRRYMIYSTNNGPSAVIDNYGNTLTKSTAFSSEVISEKVYMMDGSTPFMLLGSWPIVLLSITVLLGMIWRFNAKKDPLK